MSVLQISIDTDSKVSILSAINQLYRELNERFPHQDFLDEDRMLMDLDLAQGDPWASGSTTDPSFRGDSHAV